MKKFATIGLAVTLATAGQFALADKDIDENTPGAQKAVNLIGMWVDAGAPEGKFNYTDLSGRNWEGDYQSDILPLFVKHNVWGDNLPACASCHSGNTEHSLHEMDLTGYKGLMIGGDALSKPPGVPLLGQSKSGSSDFNWNASKLKERLRNNRMPPNMQFDISETNRDGPCVDLSSDSAKILTGKYGCDLNAVGMIGAWVEGGATQNDPFEYAGVKLTFEKDVKQLFVTHGIWQQGTMACASCHSGHTENSLHEMDLTSYEGIMSGGDVLSKPPGVPILGESKIGASDFDWANSKLKGRLRNNRMPPGIEFDISEENRDGPVVLHGMRADD